MAPPGGGARSNQASLAIDNLRAVVIVLVLAFHSVLAYLSFLPSAPFPFSEPPFLWRSFPVVDSHRWVGFDVFCAWLDVFLMSFFFLLSGLFVWPSLKRKGACAFLADRLLRLGVPFAVVVLLVMPVALYPVYLQTADQPGIGQYWEQWLALPLWPCGPVWFLWLLLVGDIAAAGLFRAMPTWRDGLAQLSRYAAAHPARFFAAFVLASMLAYVPLALAFGPLTWFQYGPFALQLSRPLHYAAYFCTGVVIGACGIENGLLASRGPLARGATGWIAAVPLFALWLGLTALMRQQGASPVFWLELLADASFVLACFASCFGVLALAMRFCIAGCRLLDNLRDNAYGIYLVHYLFVVWLQYALLPADLPAVIKAALVFAATMLLSSASVATLRRVPATARVLGAVRARPVALGSRDSRGAAAGLPR